MTLRGPQTRLDLSIVSGPDVEGWCQVSITIDTPDGRWSATDPCLTGPEVERLAAWLDLAANGVVPGRLEFLEPELVFDVADGQLRVELRFGMRPSWADGDPSEPFCITVPAESQQLHRAANSLRADLVRRSKW